MDQSTEWTKKQQELLFNDAFNQLNDNQKQAVTQFEGPLFVLAGPGTGKTQILAMRIGYILQHTDAQPHNILCLTYTDAGTIAMRKRLLQFIGPTAYNLHIFTFHAFTNQVIRENMHLFGGIKELQPLSDLEKTELFIDLIDQIPTDNPLKRFKGKVYYDQKNLESLFNDMKREGWDPQFIKNKIEEYLENLKNDPEMFYKRKTSTKTKVYEKGDFKENAFNEAVEKMNRLKAAADQFDVYENMLMKRGRYDYDDMILWVLKAFEEHPNLLLKYQEQYLYFLVDEYQDTNGAQNKILEKLIDYWASPNVFAVGDDDQAIYRFQGANMENILGFVQKYNPQVIVLNTNYRSVQQIIDASSALIKNNQQRLNNQLQIDKNISASEANKLITYKVAIHEYPNPAQEEAAIFWEIHKLKNEGFPLNKIAVIYRNHKQVENLTKVLEGENFPVNIRKKLDILTEPYIANIIGILQFIHYELKETGLREDLLFQTMIAPIFGVKYSDTIRISKATAYNRETKEKKFWLEIISDKDVMISIGISEADKIHNIYKMLTNWINLAPTTTVQLLFEKIITESGMLNKALTSPDSHWKIQLLTSLFDFIKSESVRNPFMKLGDFIDSLDKMKQSGISLPLVKIISSNDGVHFITAHSAKGLEFQKVFLIGATKDNWEGKNAGNTGFGYPPNILLANQENKEEDERRVFYVAATRAEQELFISYAGAKDDGAQIEASRYVTELAEATTAITRKECKVDIGPLISYKARTMQELALPPHEWLESSLIDEVLENYEMSVTDLNKYLRCPVTFYYENIIRVPSARTASTGFGSAIHFALEQFFKDSLKTTKKGFGSAQLLTEFFQTGMKIYRSHFTEKEFALHLHLGVEILNKYHADKLASWFEPDDYKMEHYISNVHFNQIPIKGMIDKIEFYKDGVHVIDYKTGKPENAKKKVSGPKNEEDPGGDYWRQIIFYKILLDNDTKNRWTVISGSVDLIEPENNGSFYRQKFFFKPEEVRFVEKQLTEVYGKIRNHEFAKGCGKQDCIWCNFVRNRTSLLEMNRNEERE